MSSVEWDDTQQVYHVVLIDEKTRETRTETAHIVISAVGGLDVPQIPKDLHSISDFKGAYFHSARWDHSVDLKNKRVAIIGNGSTAYALLCYFVIYSTELTILNSNQFLPMLAQDPTINITHFMRTPAWIVPRVSPLNYRVFLHSNM